MIDEYLDCFLTEFSDPTKKITATSEEIEAYRGVLPDKLLEYWQLMGFSAFQHGLFWITNPADFDDVLESFLENTEFNDYDNYHVIARSAYGELYLWGEKTGNSLEIIPHLNWITTKQGDEKDIQNGQAKNAIQRFFAFKEINDIDVKSHSKPLFPDVLKQHGSVGADEVMVFTPYLFMGGKKSVKKMKKESLQVFLQIIADMGGAEIIDMAAMVGNVVKHYGE